jgi:hypothetical protein
MQGFLDQNGALIGLVGLVLSVLALGASAFLLLRARRKERHWSAILRGADGKSIEPLLKDHFEATAKVNERLDGIVSRLDAAETKLVTSKRFVGVHRYDAFDDVGGSQSFAIAVYDDKGDGAVITSMVGRADCRVYAKEIRGGRADRELSHEEQAAIEAAVKPRTPPTEAKAGR